MAFTDEYQFTAEAGAGGNGVVRWTREKFRPKGGPCGGDGGRGGNVFIETTRDIFLLARISQKHSYVAERGGDGAAASKIGRDGRDLTIRLPVGSVVTNTTTGEILELISEGGRTCVLKGGRGGFGNEHYKSSTNQQPMHATEGRRGEKASFKVELKLFADMGLVGLPNAGKTSLLNALTNANAKVGDYPFTTLDPNLGVCESYVLADIPGLIEGASSGKGLGYKFLRHVSRTRMLVHCISSEQENVLDAYTKVRNEICAYGSIGEKKEVIVVTKSDMTTPARVSGVTRTLRAAGGDVIGSVTVLSEASVRALRGKLLKCLSTATQK